MTVAASLLVEYNVMGNNSSHAIVLVSSSLKGKEIYVEVVWNTSGFSTCYEEKESV